MEKNVNETNNEETLVIYHDDNIASEIEGSRFRVEEIGRQFYQSFFANKTKMEKVLEGGLYTFWNS
ncbi:uncharacterized protein G2W53_039326 [Senna tora]|uniref:Uncharacterized protein n=1 Tax=Senna tora TaxID=362788 RepID=A0A834SQJ2_9FABA|nr:uncharacterized protein G2W53_039326 [Senna tora]